MSVRVGINGFGRIGRNFFRSVRKRGADVEVVAVNDLGDAETMAHLLKYDSVLGPLDADVEAADGAIRVDGDELKLLNERDPGALPWGDLGVDVVLESTGLFTKREKAQLHLDAGAPRVVISAPGDRARRDGRARRQRRRLRPRAPPHHLERVLHDELRRTAREGAARHLGHRVGFMTTIHAYTNDQQILDLPHSDLRRARAAAINLIPTSTGAAKAIGLVIPDLAGKVDGISVRAPVSDGSIVDLVVQIGSEVTVDEVNARFREAADAGRFEGILRYTDEPIVSSDMVGNSFSSIFDSG